MATPAQSIYIPPTAQEGLREQFSAYLEAFQSADDMRLHFEEIDRLYMREKNATTEHTLAKAANKAGDATKYQDITVPVVYPQVETALEYQSEVFLTGYPMFSFVAAPQHAAAMKQMNTIMEENSIRGQWAREFILAFREGFKYNICCLEVDWQQKAVAALETDIQKSATEGTPKEIIWSGNVIKYRSMYNTFFDLRYQPAEISARGEYAGYHELMSRTELKTFINSLKYRIIANVVPALESADVAWGTRGQENTFYIPQLRPDRFEPRDSITEPNWERWAGFSSGKQQINYKNSYVVSTIYARIIPADFNLKVAAQSTPQIWKLTWVNHRVLICAERLTNAHNMLPMVFGQPLEDGLGYQTKSLAENVAPFQSVSTALMAAKMASHRRALSDRTLYDPSRISERHINSDNPSAKIPVRPAAYGKPLNEAVYPFPFRDDQGPNIMSDMQTIMQFADLTMGTNRSRKGQFQKGNKTLREYEDVMMNSQGRDRLTSIMIENQIMVPIKEMLKTNIVQYQPMGKIFSLKYEEEVAIDPVELRKTAMAFKVSDGLLPSSKVISADTLQVGFQTIGSSEQLAAQYNLAPMFSYLMATQNADLAPFEKSPAQVAYEQAAMQWQQMAMLAMEKGTAFNTPQPTPQQFGYNPQQQVQPASSDPVQAVPTESGTQMQA